MFKSHQLYSSAANITRKFLSNNNKFTIGETIPFSVTGGTVTSAGITPGNGYRYHVFTSPGTLTVSGSGLVEYLVVAGGGGGGTGTGGGGGAGGVRNGTIVISSPQIITVGTGATAQNFPTASVNGAPSVFGLVAATGGGRGATGSPSGAVNSASPGGSGGGGMSYPTASAPTGGTGNAGGYTPPEGNNGGNDIGGNGGAGGGGAGAVGSNGPGGNGGAGTPLPGFAAPLISPQIPVPAQPTWIPAVGPTGLYGGGGGGATGPAGGGTGGSGGGGPSSSNAGTPGVNFTGGGGGGTWFYSAGNPAGGGGSGIVIIRYLV